MADLVMDGQYVDPTVTTTAGNASPTTAPAAKTRATRLQMSQSVTFQGPIPPPELLKQYNEIIPDGADRILKMAEAQSAHRIDLESTVVKGDNRRANWGLITGYSIGIIIIVLSFILILYRHDLAGTVLGSVDLVALVSVFVYGRSVKIKELERRNQKNQSLTRRN